MFRWVNVFYEQQTYLGPEEGGRWGHDRDCVRSLLLPIGLAHLLAAIIRRGCEQENARLKKSCYRRYGYYHVDVEHHRAKRRVFADRRYA